VMHFVELLGRRLGRQIEHIPVDTMSALSSYSIRELQNLIERAVILSNLACFRILCRLPELSLLRNHDCIVRTIRKRALPAIILA
jgi:transcriptional regulator with GAF, ATPase, and Fis domain